MFCKSLFLIFISLCLLTGGSKTNFKPVPYSDDNDSLNPVLEIIKLALDLITNNSTKFLNEIKKVLDILNESFDPLEEIVRKTFSEAIDVINKALVDFIEDAQQRYPEIEGIAECLLIEDDNLTLLFHQALNTTSQCRADQFQLFTDEVDQVIDDFLTINSNITELEKTLIECQHDTALCIEEFLEGLQDVWLELKPTFLKDWGSLYEFITWFNAEFEKCNNLGYDVLDEGGHEIYLKVVKCVEDKVKSL